MPDIDRNDTVPTGLAEPLASLLAFLSDLEEQIEMFQQQGGCDEFATAVLNELKQRVAAMGLLVTLKDRS